MKKIRLMAAVAAVTAGAVLAPAGAHAQTKPLQVWQPPQQDEPDPSKRVPQTPQPVTTTEGVSQSTTQPQSSTVYPQQYTAAPATPTRYEEDRGGFFLGVQGGKGWVYEDVDQTALMVNAGYRWQAGVASLVGIEVASGRLDETTQDGWIYSKVDYASIGVNARFNFGRDNPVYGLVRAGYWSAEGDYGMDVDGGYVGLGLGVDFNRHFNMSLIYTNHVYFNDYYWEGSDFYYDANRADTLMLGAEVRF
jgi:hypothetical protein